MKRPLKDLLNDLPQVIDEKIKAPEFQTEQMLQTIKKRKARRYYVGALAAGLLLFLLSTFFQPEHPAAQKIEYSGFECPQDHEVIQTTEKDKENLQDHLEEIIKKVYKDPEYDPYQIKSIELSPQAAGGYKEIIEKNCSLKIYENSWIVQVTFPKLEPLSASMSQGQIFVAKTKKGWVVWEQYH